MKKNYIQPIIETTNLIAGGQALCSSPTGIGYGGDSENISDENPLGD